VKLVLFLLCQISQKCNYKRKRIFYHIFPVFERKNRQISKKQKFELFLPNFYMDLREVAFFVVMSATQVLSCGRRSSRHQETTIKIAESTPIIIKCSSNEQTAPKGTLCNLTIKQNALASLSVSINPASIHSVGLFFNASGP